MKKEQTIWIAKIAIVAALYVALTLASYPLSYGMIQFRISEVLMLLVCYNKKYSWSMILGCIIANFFSFNILDCIIGTSATALACLAMIFIKNRYLASLCPVISNGVIVGLEIFFLFNESSASFYSCMGFVALGELVVVVLLGNLLFFFLEKNEHIMHLIKD